ncbi:2374_t:CDS:2, partial [Gigaspora margarita]
HGTLSSYTWTCMILNFLQMRDPPILPVLQIPDIPLNNEVDLSFYQNIDSLKGFGIENHELIGGLFFAYEYDYKSKVISLRQGKFLNKRKKKWGHWKLCVEEPFITSRNLGNGINHISFKRIINEFHDFCDECEQKNRSFFISKKVLKKTKSYLELKNRVLGS